MKLHAPDGRIGVTGTEVVVVHRGCSRLHICSGLGDEVGMKDGDDWLDAIEYRVLGIPVGQFDEGRSSAILLDGATERSVDELVAETDTQ